MGQRFDWPLCAAELENSVGLVWNAPPPGEQNMSGTVCETSLTPELAFVPTLIRTKDYK